MPQSSPTAPLLIHSDGGARGNPGPAATGYVITQGESTLISGGNYLGIATNNVAEYQAVLDALIWVTANLSSPYPPIQFFIDSQLVVNQLLGQWKIKLPHLRQLAEQIWAISRQHRLQITYTHVPRHQNAQADAMVNEVLDNINSDTSI
jgi:ribonuclease HI